MVLPLTVRIWPGYSLHALRQPTCLSGWELTMPNRPPVYKLRTLAAEWDVDKETVRQRILSGKLGAFMVGKQYRITTADKRAFERENRVCPVPITGSDTSRADPTSMSSGPRITEPVPGLRGLNMKRRLRQLSPTGSG